MWHIKKIDEEFNEELFESECIKSFIVSNIELFKSGWRLYVNGVDVTEDANAIASNEHLIMMKPAKGISIVVTAIVAAAVGAIAIKALTPKPEAPVTSNRTQSSATNSLGARNNEFNIGGRIDDIWGKVSNHVPRLMQVPHFRFEDNVETEHFAIYISNGEGLIESVRDGNTKFERLSNSKFNAWYPGSNPNTTPNADYVIGGLID
ncbi:MAG: hypothetical protein ACPG5L_08175, partial [Vibrio gallaecicus]